MWYNINTSGRAVLLDWLRVFVGHLAVSLTPAAARPVASPSLASLVALASDGEAIAAALRRTHRTRRGGSCCHHDAENSSSGSCSSCIEVQPNLGGAREGPLVPTGLKLGSSCMVCIWMLGRFSGYGYGLISLVHREERAPHWVPVGGTLCVKNQSYLRV